MTEDTLAGGFLFLNISDMEAKIINENVVQLFVRFRELEKVFNEELDNLEDRSAGIRYDDIRDKFWNGYGDVMEAFKRLLGETAEQNANDD